MDLAFVDSSIQSVWFNVSSWISRMSWSKSVICKNNNYLSYSKPVVTTVVDFTKNIPNLGLVLWLRTNFGYIVLF